MAKKPKIKYKPAKIDTRVPERIRYGAELMARKMGLSISGYVGRALEEKLKADGIDRREPGEIGSLLDKLWSSREDERLLNLANYAPELMTSDEQSVVSVVMRVPRFWKPLAEKAAPVDFDPNYLVLSGGIVDLEETGIFWELIVKAGRGESVDWKKEFADYDAAAPKFDASPLDFD